MHWACWDGYLNRLRAQRVTRDAAPHRGYDRHRAAVGTLGRSVPPVLQQAGDPAAIGRGRIATAPHGATIMPDMPDMPSTAGVETEGGGTPPPTPTRDMVIEGVGSVREEGVPPPSSMQGPEAEKQPLNANAIPTAATAPPTDILRQTQLNALPVWVQWALSAAIVVVIIVWVIAGNVAEGTIGQPGCPVDSWLVPLLVGVAAYIAAYGFFGLPLKTVLLSELLPMYVLAGFAVLFASRGALLPYTIGCGSCSFMLILTVFNSGVTVEVSLAKCFASR